MKNQLKEQLKWDKSQGKLEKLNSLQEAKMLEIKQYWLDYIFSCKNTVINKEECKIGIEWLYKLSGKKEPIVIYVDSPMGCQYGVALLKNLLKDRKKLDSVWASVGASVWASVGASVGASVWASVWASVGDSVAKEKIEYNNFGSYGAISDYGWISFYDFFTAIGVIDHASYNQFKRMLLSGIYDTIQLEGFCIVSSLPIKISRNERGDLHCVDSAAIEFKDGYKQWYINGREVPVWIFDDYNAGTLTFDKFNKETNEDIRAAIITMIKERESNEGLVKFLQANIADEQQVVHQQGYIETMKLWKTKKKYQELQNSKGEYNQQACWLQLTCPSTGQTYLIDCCPLFTNAIDAAKWLRPKRVPTEVPYCWESAN